MSAEDRLHRLLREQPEYRGILEKAIKFEENPPSDFARKYGWEWYDVAGHPARLTKLVSEGVLKVTYKSRRYTHYKLTDCDAVRRALRTAGPPNFFELGRRLSRVV